MSPDPEARAIGIERLSGAKDRVSYRVVAKGPKPRSLWEGGDLLEARRRGERLAAEWNLPLHDESTGRFRSREPGELNLPMGVRLRREAEAPPRPQLPEGTRLRWQPGPEAVIEFPGQRLSPLIVLFMLGVPTVILAALWLFSTSRTAPLFVPLGGLFLLPVGWALAGAMRPKYVRVDATGVEVRRLGYRRTIAFAKLEEAVVTPGGIHLLSDDVEAFVADWSDSVADLRFVAQVIEEAAYRAAPPGESAPGPVAPSAPLDAPAARPTSSATPASVRGPGSPARSRRGTQALEQARVVGTVFLILGLCGLAGAGYWSLRLRDFLARATVTTGTVVELRPSRSSKGATTYRPVVSFLLPGGGAVVVTGTSGSNPAPYDLGDDVEVRYEPHEVANARIGSLRNVWAGPVFLGGLSAVFAVAGLFARSRHRRQAVDARGNLRVD